MLMEPVDREQGILAAKLTGRKESGDLVSVSWKGSWISYLPVKMQLLFSMPLGICYLSGSRLGDCTSCDRPESLSWHWLFLEGKVFFGRKLLSFIVFLTEKKMEGCPARLAHGAFYKRNSFYRWLYSLLLTSWTPVHCPYWQSLLS